MTETVLVTQHEGWLEICLNRPERLNAFNDQMHAELRAALSKAAGPEIRAVLITGAGRGFCTGQDLDGRDPRKMSAPPDLGHTLETLYNPLVDTLQSLEKPVIAAVNGAAAGAGANIAFACDIVLANESAKFIQSFAKVGLVPDAGGTWVLPRLIGLQRAKAWAMTAEPIDASTAFDWGLVWKVFPDDQMLSAAREMVSEFAKAATKGLAGTKALMQASFDNSLGEQLVLEAKTQLQCGRSEDYREGVTAFLDKRPADYKGR